MKHPILYIHGALASPDSFTYLMSGMPDDRGWSYSLYDVRTQSLDEIMSDLRIDVSTMEVPVHVVGHSLGGVLAVNLAHEIPEWVASVTTLAAPFKGAEIPLFVRMLHFHSQFIQNLSPTHRVYQRSQKKPPVPLQVLKTTGGYNPLFGFDNDGVISTESQHHCGADRSFDTPWNHFEVLMHPSIREAILKFIDDVEETMYK